MIIDFQVVVVSIATVATLETHNVIVKMYDVFSQDGFPIYSCLERILQ